MSQGGARLALKSALPPYIKVPPELVITVILMTKFSAFPM